jgi:hypothetical protein
MHDVDKDLLQFFCAREKYFAFIGEVAKKSPLGKPRSLSDFGNGCVLKSLISEEF